MYKYSSNFSLTNPQAIIRQIITTIQQAGSPEVDKHETNVRNLGT